MQAEDAVVVARGGGGGQECIPHAEIGFVDLRVASGEVADDSAQSEVGQQSQSGGFEPAIPIHAGDGPRIVRRTERRLVVPLPDFDQRVAIVVACLLFTHELVGGGFGRSAAFELIEQGVTRIATADDD